MWSSMDDLSETAPVAVCWVPPESFRDFRFLTPVLKLPHWKEDGGHLAYSNTRESVLAVYIKHGMA